MCLADHYKVPVTKDSGSFDRSDYGCWSWDCLYDVDQEILTAAIDNARGDLSVVVRIHSFGRDVP